MSKYLQKTTTKGKREDDTATIVAEMHGVTPRYVRMVIAGDRTNEGILTSYMQFKEGKNLMIQAVKQAIPFEKQPSRTR